MRLLKKLSIFLTFFVLFTGFFVLSPKNSYAQSCLTDIDCPANKECTGVGNECVEFDDNENCIRYAQTQGSCTDRYHEPPAQKECWGCEGDFCRRSQVNVSDSCPSPNNCNACPDDSPPPPSYTCANGTLCNGASVTGSPGQQVCGAGEDYYTCTAPPGGWVKGGACTCSDIPAGPTNLSGSCPVPGTTATISWSPVMGATSYSVRVNNNSNGWSGNCDALNSGDKCSSQAGTSYSFTSSPGESYGWWVHACNAGGCSGPVSPSAGFTCTASDCTTTPVCTGTCTATANTCSTNNGTKSGCNYIGPTPCTQVTAPDQVCTIDACTSPNTCVGGVCGTFPAGPGNLLALCPMPGTTGTLSWTAVTGATGATYYNVRVDNQANVWSGNCNALNSGDYCASPTINSYSFTSSPEAGYGWWIEACNSYGCSSVVNGSGFVCTPTPAWFQVKDADLITKSLGSITSAIPNTSLFNLIGNGGYPGILVSPSINVTPASQISSKNWKVNSSYTGRDYNYDWYSSLIPSGTKTVDCSSGCTLNSGQLSNEAASIKAAIVVYNGNVTISSANLNNKKLQIFVNGNLNINGDINLDKGDGYFGAIVKGNIVVGTDIGSNDNKDDPNIEGLFVANGQFFSGAVTTGNKSRLNVRGSIVAWGGAVLQRSLGGGNSSFPAEYFEYAPDLIFTMPRELLRNGLVWREVAP